MTNKLSYLFNYFILARKLRRSRKKRGALSFRVASPIDFMAELESIGIRYAVLRWPDKVPLAPLPKNASAQQIDAEYGDVDLLLELGENGRKRLLEAGARHFSTTGIRFEFYNTHGSGGFSYKRYPYYPPLMARKLLAQRFFDPRGFYRLAGEPYIVSLTYHVLYHKAAAVCASSSPAEEAQVADYLQRLQAEATREGIALPTPPTLESLHDWLVARHADMPFDLKVRWPRNAGWLDELARREAAQLGMAPPADFRYFCIFILRDDLEKAGLLEQARQAVGQRFEVRQVIEVPTAQRSALAARLRGGNWMEGRHGEEILPCTFLICDDPAPKPLEKPIPEYPHLDNANLRWKQKLRNDMSAIAGKRLYGVHSSDNSVEATCILKVLRDQGLTN